MPTATAAQHSVPMCDNMATSLATADPAQRLRHMEWQSRRLACELWEKRKERRQAARKRAEQAAAAAAETLNVLAQQASSSTAGKKRRTEVSPCQSTFLVLAHAAAIQLCIHRAAVLCQILSPAGDLCSNHMGIHAVLRWACMCAVFRLRCKMAKACWWCCVSSSL